MAENTLEIVIKASAGQAVTTLKQVDKAVGSIGKSGGTVDTLKSKWASLNQTLSSPGGFKFLIGTAGAVVGALTGIGIAAKKLADGFQDYAFEVEDFARVLGVSAEEASKLIQVADDVRLSTGSMTAAFKFAIKQGINPSIDSLGQLSDEYLALGVGADRSRFLLEKFGRAGLEMGKLLELGSDKIKEMGNSIEGTARLMTDEGIKAAKEYYAAMDNLGDVIIDLKLILGSALLPAIVDVTNAFTDFVVTSIDLLKALNYLEIAENAGIISTKEYWNQLYLLSTSAYNGADALKFLQQAGVDLNAVFGVGPDMAEQLRQNIEGVGDEAEDAEPKLRGLQKAALDTGSALDKALNRQYELGVDFKLPDVASQVANWVKSDQWAAAGGDAAGKFIEAFKTQLAGLDPAARAEILKNVAAIELAAKVEIGEINISEATTQLQDLFGGTYAENKNIITAAVELDANTPADITAALQELDPTLPVIGEITEESKASIITAVAELDAVTAVVLQMDMASRGDLIENIQAIKPVIDVAVKWHWQGKPPPGGAGGGTGGTGGPNKQEATGGQFIVPPGYPRDTFLLGVTSGERVSVQTPNQQASQPAQITNIYNIAPVAALNYRELARQVTREQQRQNVR